MRQRTMAKQITRATRSARVPYDATKAAAIRADALDRATKGQSLANFPAIIEGFTAKGIPEDQILPRVNVFTYEAWKVQGRQVRRGEHGVKVVTFVEMSKTSDDDKEPETWRHPRSTTVFHVSQTDEVEA